MSTLPGLQECLNRHDRAIRKAESRFSSLTADQLNLRPAPNAWGVGLCLEHIMVTDQTYFPVFEVLMADNYQFGIWAGISPFSALLGRKLAAEMLAEDIAPSVAPAAFKPNEQKLVDAGIVSRFVVHGRSMQTQLSGLANLNPKIVVASPAFGLITYPLADCIRILCGHTVRHVDQAERALITLGI